MAAPSTVGRRENQIDRDTSRGRMSMKSFRNESLVVE